MKNDSQSPLELLGAVPLFRGCTNDELRLLDRAATRATYPAGHVLCREGGVGRELFIVLEGEAIVERDGVQITTLGPGDFIGELSLLDGGPRSATATAKSEMTALTLLPHEFWQVMDEVPPIARKLLTSLAGRLRQANAAAYYQS